MRVSHVLSLALHAVIALLVLFSPRMRPAPEPARPELTRITLPRNWKPLAAEGSPDRGAGSGQHDILRASYGLLPQRARFSIPPAVRESPPKVIIDAGLDLPPDVLIPRIEAAVYGDPFGVRGALSGGVGKGGFPGDGEGSIPGPGHGSRGLGPGDQPGVFGGGKQPGTLRPAELVYRVEPEFSEEARKAKYQGMVVLLIDISLDGHASNFRVVQTLGMGLEEKAIEAVGRWRFRPATRNGKPVVTAARVEVNFRLL